MADKTNLSVDGNFKEAVCVDAGRVYDSCCDRDCLEDLRCFFIEKNQEIINDAISVRLRSAEILNVYIDVEPVNFNKGYYSCDLTFFFLMDFDVFTEPLADPTRLTGLSSFHKKVILFGSEGNVRAFSNTAFSEDPISVQTDNMPRCVVRTVEPVPLSARLGVIRDSYENVRFMPESVTKALGGPIVTQLEEGTPAIYASIGLFSIVQLIRNVQMLIPVYDFCIPEKQCDDTTDQPCDAFSRIAFPTDDFFPPRSCALNNENGCGCK